MRLILPACLFLLVALAGCGPTKPAVPPTSPVAAPAGTTLIAALGDSITAGSPLWDPSPDVRAQIGDDADERSQFEYWARRRLGAGRVSFRNCGVFGERTDEIATRLDGCARGAKVLLLQGGINDIAQGRPIEDAARNLRAMLRRGRSLGLRVLLVDVLPWNNGYPKAQEPIDALNARIRAIGRSEGVPVLPFFKALEDPGNLGKMRSDLTIDGDHPSIEGYQRLAALIPAP